MWPDAARVTSAQRAWSDSPWVSCAGEVREGCQAVPQKRVEVMVGPRAVGWAPGARHTDSEPGRDSPATPGLRPGRVRGSPRQGASPGRMKRAEKMGRSLAELPHLQALRGPGCGPRWSAGAPDGRGSGPWKAGPPTGITMSGAGAPRVEVQARALGRAGKGGIGRAMMGLPPGCTFKEHPPETICIHQSRDGRRPTVSMGDCVSHTQHPR